VPVPRASSADRALPPVPPDSRGPSGHVRPRAARPAVSSRGPARDVGNCADGDGVWVPAGQVVQVGGYPISGGLVYVGRELAAATGGQPDPALINPSLDVDHRSPDYVGAHMGYWPSYSTIAPTCRAAYLQWLADGRHEPHACIGYVFLYFYGLERRLLIDAQKSALARTEREMLVTEIWRLLDIYGTSGSFRGYAESLLAYVTADDNERRYLFPPPTHRDGWEVPFELRLGLGQLAADARPVPTDWALAWLRLHPEGWLRTPATRCPDEFGEVFTRRYRERCGDGLMLQPSGAILAQRYRPASAGIAEAQLPPGRKVPDVASLGAPLARLREIAGQACDDLDAYSRYIGRHPDGTGTAVALSLLPPGIARPANAATEALLAWADDILGTSDWVQAAASELLTRWSAASPGSQPGKSGAVLLARVLEAHGLGLEPDVRFGGTPPADRAPVVLFRRASEVVSAPSDGYAAGAALIQLGAAVASADGRVAPAEQEFLERRVVASLGLTQDEDRRLHAHLMCTLAAPPTTAALRKRASLLPENQRRSAGALLVALAASDGDVAPAEIDLLVRLFDVLGLERSEVYRQIHTADAETLTRMRMAGAPAADYSIPGPSSREVSRVGGHIVLNQDLIKARQAESARAASFLTEIFTDEDTATLAAVPPGDGATTIAADQPTSLDTAHGTLLNRLAARPSWTRSDFAGLAADLGLLPDGALEVLNEAAFETVGEPVCEGNDPIDINSYAVEEMLQ
jgi:uncharacterized tellurite resistance protein B-like protein